MNYFFYFLITITICAVLMSAIARNFRHASLALWITGLGVGGIYLTLGMETLAILQWIVSTLVLISLIFFSILFGEYPFARSYSSHQNSLIAGLSPLLGVGFMGLFWMGTKILSEERPLIPIESGNLEILGKALIEDHLLSLEVLGLTLFLVLVGGGVLARLEKSEVLEP